MMGYCKTEVLFLSGLIEFILIEIRIFFVQSCVLPSTFILIAFLELDHVLAVAQSELHMSHMAVDPSSTLEM